MPKRLNRAIELLEAGQPVFPTSAGQLTYENGKQMAGTYADIILVDFEHGAFDVVGLHQFIRGLVDGGPTPSGHRIPCVISTLPSNCRTRDEVIANQWQIRQVLTAGVQGVLHTHARQASAVQAFVEGVRYVWQTIGVGNGLGQGQRGGGGQRTPAEIWGLDPVEYMRLADPWPLNPEGELLLGLKIEDREGMANADQIAAVPGIAFAEWGPGDMGMSHGYADAHDPPYPADMDLARETIKSACDRNGVKFYSSWNDPTKSLKENYEFAKEWGVAIPGGYNEEAARIGHEVYGRTMFV